MTVTFNENQLRSHLVPLLCLPEVEGVTLVADREPAPLPKLRAVVPPRLMRHVLGRAGAKLVVCLVLALRERPDWVVGYNLVPHGLNAWLVGKLTGTRSLYHMIGGPGEWEGGGWCSDNRLTGCLPRPVPALERLLLRVVRGCTAVVTMGESGRRALLERGADPRRVHAVPPTFGGLGEPPERRVLVYELVTVAQLIPRKRPWDLVEAVHALRPRFPALRAAVVGEGPLAADLRRRAAELGVEDAIDFLGFRDPREIYAVSGVFVLTSRSEGLPVSMIEAMACGLPVLVSDVGEVRDLVCDGRNGYVFPVGDVAALVERASALLADASFRSRLGGAARHDVLAHAGVEHVSELYREIFTLPPAPAPPAAAGGRARGRMQRAG